MRRYCRFYRFGRAASATILILFLVASCAGVQPKPGVDPNEADLRRVGEALRDTAASIAVFEQVILDANKQGTLSDDTARPLIAIVLQVSQAGKQATIATTEIHRLAPADRQQILNILVPVIDAVQKGLTDNIVTISDLKTRQDLRTVLLLVQTSLSTAQLVLAATHG